MSKEKISIIIPVYNGSNYLADSIESALNQSWSNKEIIVINDGSDDDGKTREIAKRYHDRIVYIEQSNKGTAAALNTGIRHMKGDFFVWLPHDDLLCNEFITCLMDLVNRYDVEIAIASGEEIDVNGTVKRTNLAADAEVKRCRGVGQLLLHGVIVFNGAVISRSVLERYGFFDENLPTTQDVEFLFRILRKEDYVCTNKILYQKRQHDQQGTNTRPDFWQNTEAFHAYVCKELTENECKAMMGDEALFFFRQFVKFRFHSRYRGIAAASALSRFYDSSRSKRKGDNTRQRERLLSLQPIWIYGAGVRGRQLLFDLRCRGLDIEAFLDNDPGKLTTFIDGVPCTGVDDYCGSTVIVSAKQIEKDMGRDHLTQRLGSFFRMDDFRHQYLSDVPDIKSVMERIREYEEKNYFRSGTGI